MKAKGMSNSGTVHLLLDGSNAEAACARGKVRPRIVPLSAAEAETPLTCKRCLRIEWGQAQAEALAAAADTASIDAVIAEAETGADALLAEVASTNELGRELVEAILQEPARRVRDVSAALYHRELAAQVQTDAEAELTDEQVNAAAQPLPDARVVEDAEIVETPTGELAAQVPGEEAAAAPQPMPTQKRQRVNQKELVLAFLTARLGQAFTPHQISKAVTPEGTKRLGLRDVCARLAAKGELEMVEGEKAATYRVPAPGQAGA